jgi:hypothetical protein
VEHRGLLAVVLEAQPDRVGGRIFQAADVQRRAARATAACLTAVWAWSARRRWRGDLRLGILRRAQRVGIGLLSGVKASAALLFGLTKSKAEVRSPMIARR